MVKLSDIGPSSNGDTYTSDPSTESHLSRSPLLIDPYEVKMVTVRTSSIPGAGLGVFTVRPVRNSTIIGFFNGVHIHREEVFSQAEKSAYLVEGSHPNEFLNIPKQFQP